MVFQPSCFNLDFNCLLHFSCNSFDTGFLRSTLENTLLGLGFCFAAVSRNPLDPESSCGHSGTQDASGTEEEDCSLFRFFEIKHTDLNFATAGVCELVLGVKIFDLDFGVQVESVKEPI